MIRVAIVDYGVGNLYSLKRGMEVAGARAIVTRDAAEIAGADAVVLPGVGAFGSAMEQLRDKVDAILEAARDKPLLGSCLGMQLLLDSSEEGDGPGLGLIKGRVVRLPRGLRIPHMGWNSLKLIREHPLVDGVADGAHVYFMHSYYAQPEDEACIVAATTYGVEFPSIIARGELVGTQFHPEKSGAVGLRMLKNFVGMVK